VRERERERERERGGGSGWRLEDSGRCKEYIGEDSVIIYTTGSQQYFEMEMRKNYKKKIEII